MATAILKKVNRITFITYLSVPRITNYYAENRSDIRERLPNISQSNIEKKFVSDCQTLFHSQILKKIRERFSFHRAGNSLTLFGTFSCSIAAKGAISLHGSKYQSTA